MVGVINVSSIAGLRYLGAPYIAYNATKGSIISFTRNLAAEQALNGIRANAILPGFIDTPMARKVLQKNSANPEKIDWPQIDRQRNQFLWGVWVRHGTLQMPLFSWQ